MRKLFIVYERVPSWVSYRKVVWAHDREHALSMAKAGWDKLEGAEEGPFFGDVIDGMDPDYEAEEVPATNAE